MIRKFWCFIFTVALLPQTSFGGNGSFEPCQFIVDRVENGSFPGLISEAGVEKKYKTIFLRPDRTKGADKREKVLIFEIDVDNDGVRDIVVENIFPLYGHSYFNDFYIMPYSLVTENDVRNFIESSGWSGNGPKLSSILFQPVDLMIPDIEKYYKKSKYLSLNFVTFNEQNYLLASYVDMKKAVRWLYLVKYESLRSNAATLICDAQVSLFGGE